MIHIAIVEDNPEVREQLIGYVHRYERQYGKMFELTAFADGDEIVSDYRAVYDIILLDIQMRRMDGMAAAEAIRKVDRDVILIFITNMAQFAIRGYAVDALDYILKPVPYFAFPSSCRRRCTGCRSARPFFSPCLIDVSTIYYLASEGHSVRFYTEYGDFSAPGSLKSYEEKLAGKPFARCNSGYIVNLAQVLAVQQNIVQVGPHSLQISRPRKKPFLEALTDYIGGSDK